MAESDATIDQLITQLQSHIAASGANHTEGAIRLLADAMVARGSSSTGPGGGPTPAQIQGAIEAATNLANVANTLSSILSAVDGVEGFVDGLESGQTTLNNSIVTLQGLVDQLEGYTDGLEGLVTAVRDRLMPQGTPYFALGASASAGANIKPTPGVIYSITCSNQNSATRWFQLFDKATAPSNGEAPIRSFPIYGNGGFLCLGSEIFSGAGLPFTAGIAFGFSTTPTTYTAGVATEAIVSVRYS